MTFDPKIYRRALSCFATGVAVVTTTEDDGTPVGMTISSFNSVSIDPPLVLWSIAKVARRYEQFVSNQYFVVNVLALHQQDLSTRFSRSGGNEFAGLEWVAGLGGAPILPEYAACFECETENVYEGGDHKIIVGRVCELDDRETDPLIFYRGQFLEKVGA